MSQPIQNTQTECSLLSAGLHVGAYAIAGLLTPVGPLGGAIFGATSYLGSYVIGVICDNLNCDPNNELAKTIKYVSSVLGSIAIASTITTLVGFPITFTTGAVLTIASGLIAITGIVAGACLGISALAGAAVYGFSLPRSEEPV